MKRETMTLDRVRHRVLVDRGKGAYKYRKDEVTLDKLIRDMYEVTGYDLNENMPDAGAGG